MGKLLNLNNQVMNIVVHPYFVPLIMDFKKTACMIQDNFIQDAKVIFEYPDTEKKTTVPFASAIARTAAILKITPKSGKIERNVLTSQGWIFKALDKETIKKVLNNEGFPNGDDFFRNLETREPFFVTQVYFDTLSRLK